MIPRIEQLFLEKDTGDLILWCGANQLAHGGAEWCAKIIHLLDHVFVVVRTPFRSLGQLCL